MGAADDSQPINLTRGERREIRETLAHHEPLDSGRGILAYYNGDGSGLTIRNVSEAGGTRAVGVEAETAASEGGVSQARKAVAAFLTVVVFAYSLIIVQQPLLGVLAGGIIYMTMVSLHG